MEFVEGEFADGLGEGCGGLGLFGEGVEGVVGGDDLIFVGVPVEEVVGGAVEEEAELFELRRLDVSDVVVDDVGRGLRHKAVADKETIRAFDAAELEKSMNVESKHTFGLRNEVNIDANTVIRLPKQSVKSGK